MTASILSVVPNRLLGAVTMGVCFAAALILMSTCGDPEPASYAARTAILR